MKTLSSALLAAQKKATGLPVISSNVKTFGHPQKAGGSGGAAADGIFPGLFNWTCLYTTDTISPSYHGVAIAGDGSLNRIRNSPVIPLGVNHQRIANPGPGSNFGAGWTLLGMGGNLPCAIAALGTEVMVVSYVNDLYTGTHYNLSSDYGQSFGGPTYIFDSGDCRRAVAVAYKPNGDCAIVGSETTTSRIWISRRIGGYWSTANYFGSTLKAESLAMYYDGDWNIIALINSYDEFKLIRIVFGDGYRVTAGYWSPYEYLNLGKATTDSYELVQQYYDRAPRDRPELPDFPPIRHRKTGALIPAPHRDYYGRRIYPSGYNAWAKYLFHDYYNRHTRINSPDWAKVSAILAARIVDNLALDAPFLCKPADAPPIVSFYRNFEKWLVRLKPGTDFYDSNWQQAFMLQGSCPYGLAIATDNNYIWGTRANEVWRSPLPAKAWATPAAGSGTGSTPVIIDQADIQSVKETIRALQSSELVLVLDNSKGQYAGLPTTFVKKGSMVSLAYGYRTTIDDVCDPPNKYFIEDWTYDREPNQATVTLRCIDAWGLLERYTIPGYQEYNQASNEINIYDLINKLMQCIGGSLSYKSRSSDITSLYPKLTIHAGETGAALLRRLLAMVPDVIFLNGVTGYIVYPQVSDSSTYSFYFPDQGAGSYHYLLDGCYGSLPYQSNRIFIIGRDSNNNPANGADEEAAEIALVGEHLDIRFNPGIATAELAAQAADAALERARLDTRSGFITLPPHCGAELFDVITVYDSLCSQEGRNYRVMGIKLTYDPSQQHYYQQLSLGEV